MKTVTKEYQKIMDEGLIHKGLHEIIKNKNLSQKGKIKLLLELDYLCWSNQVQKVEDLIYLVEFKL